MCGIEEFHFGTTPRVMRFAITLPSSVRRAIFIERHPPACGTLKRRLHFCIAAAVLTGLILQIEIVVTPL